MRYALAEFAAECHRILACDAGRSGRKAVCDLVAKACQDRDFVARYLGDDVSERQILYQDAELGFCIVGHVEARSRHSQPHDHGPTWAIYGQAEGETIMTDWDPLSSPRGRAPGKVRHVRDYVLRLGSAHIYHEGEVHSPRRDGPTRLLRIEGRNLADVYSQWFEPV